MGQRVREYHAPEMVGGFAIAASRSEAAEAPEDVAEREAGSESVDRAQRRHLAAVACTTRP